MRAQDARESKEVDGVRMIRINPRQSRKRGLDGVKSRKDKMTVGVGQRVTTPNAAGDSPASVTVLVDDARRIRDYRRGRRDSYAVVQDERWRTPLIVWLAGR